MRRGLACFSNLYFKIVLNYERDIFRDELRRRDCVGGIEEVDAKGSNDDGDEEVGHLVLG